MNHPNTIFLPLLMICVSETGLLPSNGIIFVFDAKETVFVSVVNVVFIIILIVFCVAERPVADEECV